MIIDTDNLSTLSLQEVALLLLFYDPKVDKSRTVLQVKDVDISKLLNGLRQKKYVMSSIYSTDFNKKPPYRHVAWSLLDKGKQALAENCINTSKKKLNITPSVVARCDALAPKLQELYPVGTKPGTSQKWRGSAKLVSEKLQKLISRGEIFTDDEAIAATKEYVTGFGGMYTNMRVLIYFLSKNEIVGGEVKKSCDFMSYIEDLRNNKTRVNNNNWEVELR